MADHLKHGSGQRDATRANRAPAAECPARRCAASAWTIASRGRELCCQADVGLMPDRPQLLQAYVLRAKRSVTGFGNAIDEDEAIEVIDLVLQAARLDCHRRSRARRARARLDPLDDHFGRARDVARQVRARSCTLRATRRRSIARGSSDCTERRALRTIARAGGPLRPCKIGGTARRSAWPRGPRTRATRASSRRARPRARRSRDGSGSTSMAAQREANVGSREDAPDRDPIRAARRARVRVRRFGK